MLSVGNALRFAAAEYPILFLTAKAKDEDKLPVFWAGADDYLCKPFNVDELILRVRAILRRSKNSKEKSHPLDFGTEKCD